MKSGIKFRCDGSKLIGLGHIYRMIALANLLEQEFECSFIVQKPEAGVCELLKQNNCRLQILGEDDLNLPGINSRLKDPVQKNDILVLDGYCFNTDYQGGIKDNIGCKLACVDDIIMYPFIGDLVVNHAGGVLESDYQVAPTTRLLLGPRYAILRKEFYGVTAERRSVNQIENLFINFGGADVDNRTCRVINDLLKQRIVLTHVAVVTGAVFQHYTELQEIIRKNPFVKLYQNIDAGTMVQLMKNADMAICSSSTVAYEFCSVTGLLLIIKTSENQTGLYNFLINERLALPYSLSHDLGRDIIDIRDELVSNQKKYFDGLAGVRLRKEFNRLYINDNFFLRRAVKGDVDTYFRWANDKDVRANSFKSDAISYDTHCSWFNLNIDSSESYLYIFSSGENVPIANIRFKVENETATLSYLIDERFRGLGLGKEILAQGTNFFFQDNQYVKTVQGFVKADNTASVKAFIASHFQEVQSAQTNVKCFIKTHSNE
jgi:UDP-2,4-diacetamido-2,4,6-trideoxy-beta-L-altropyranose hydrolase